MLIYTARRIFFGAAVLLGTSLITFAIAFMVPADPAVAMAGAKADPHTLATIRHQLHLDEPLYVQYGDYLARALQGDRQRLAGRIARDGIDAGVLARHDAAYRSGHVHPPHSARRARRMEESDSPDDHTCARLGRLFLAHPAHQSRRR